MTDLRLFPFPDELLEAARKAEAIDFLNASDQPSWWKARHLNRWGKMVGMKLDRHDFIAVGVSFPPEEG